MMLLKNNLKIVLLIAIVIAAGAFLTYRLYPSEKQLIIIQADDTAKAAAKAAQVARASADTTRKTANAAIEAYSVLENSKAPAVEKRKEARAKAIKDADDAAAALDVAAEAARKAAISAREIANTAEEAALDASNEARDAQGKANEKR